MHALMRGFSGNLKAAAHTTRSTCSPSMTDEKYPQHPGPIDDRILDDEYMEIGK